MPSPSKNIGGAGGRIRTCDPCVPNALPQPQPLYFQYFSSASDKPLRVSFTLFFGGSSGGSVRFFVVGTVRKKRLELLPIG
jgi:hypothetical protein